jgi:pyruvate-formate lyase-activating enzyme
MNPRFLLLDVNKRCNYKCLHCDYWKGESGPSETVDSAPIEIQNITNLESQCHNFNSLRREISMEERKNVIREFRSLNPKGRVILCGGEGTLDAYDYFGLTRYCRDLGMPCLSVTNGSTILNGKDARKMLIDGPSEITVSLDSPDEATHDFMRGVKGSYKKVLETVTLLVNERKNLGVKNRIYVMGLIGEHDYRKLDEFYDLALNTLEADKLKLNFLQPTFGCCKSWGDPYGNGFFKDYCIKDPHECLWMLNAMNDKYKLNYNPGWLSSVSIYLKSVSYGKNETYEHICNSYERNVVVNVYGNMRLCYSKKFPYAPWRRMGDMKTFWNSAESLREEMKKCNDLCGISHSVRREPCTRR